MRVSVRAEWHYRVSGSRAQVREKKVRGKNDDSGGAYQKILTEIRKALDMGDAREIPFEEKQNYITQ
jgi:hypothetical protein